MNAPKTELTVRKRIRASRDKVFAAWTQSDLLKQWFCPGEMSVPFAETNAEIGGQYRISMQDDDDTYTTTGEYQEIIPNEKLVFTWGWEGPDREESLVTVEFLDIAGETEVVLRHERFSSTELMEKHEHGWNGCLQNLENNIQHF